MRIEKLKLKKLLNTRDLGGLPAENGKIIKSGLLFRSGKLYRLSDKTLCSLKEAGVGLIIDLRIDPEVNEYPDSIPDGVRYVRLPMLCTATCGITHEKTMFRTMLSESKRIRSEFGSGDNYMIEMYKLLLFSEESLSQIRKFFEILLEEDGGVLWHCSAGKDRAGILAMLVEGVLGADDGVIKADYIASQKFQIKKRIWQKVGLWISPIAHRFRTILLVMMNAKELYVSSALDEIKQRYGSITEYCRSAVGLTDGQIQQLKDKYLE